MQQEPNPLSFQSVETNQNQIAENNPPCCQNQEEYNQQQYQQNYCQQNDDDDKSYQNSQYILSSNNIQYSWTREEQEYPQSYDEKTQFNSNFTTSQNSFHSTNFTNKSNETQSNQQNQSNSFFDSSTFQEWSQSQNCNIESQIQQQQTQNQYQNIQNNDDQSTENLKIMGKQIIRDDSIENQNEQEEFQFQEKSLFNPNESNEQDFGCGLLSQENQYNYLENSILATKNGIFSFPQPHERINQPFLNNPHDQQQMQQLNLIRIQNLEGKNQALFNQQLNYQYDFQNQQNISSEQNLIQNMGQDNLGQSSLQNSQKVVYFEDQYLDNDAISNQSQSDQNNNYSDLQHNTFNYQYDSQNQQNISSLQNLIQNMGQDNLGQFSQQNSQNVVDFADQDLDNNAIINQPQNNQNNNYEQIRQEEEMESMNTDLNVEQRQKISKNLWRKIFQVSQKKQEEEEGKKLDPNFKAYLSIQKKKSSSKQMNYVIQKSKESDINIEIKFIRFIINQKQSVFEELNNKYLNRRHEEQQYLRKQLDKKYKLIEDNI